MDRLDVIEQILVTQYELLVYLVGYRDSPMPSWPSQHSKDMEVLIEEIRTRQKTE